jgi:hypothetical protein
MVSDEFAADVHILVGTYQNKRLAFLDRKGWICSVTSLAALKPDAYDRHFFLPGDWLSSVGRLQIRIMPRDGTLIYLRGEEFISVRRGLDFRLDSGRNTTRQMSVRSSNSGYASLLRTQGSVEIQSGWEKRRGSVKGSSLESHAEEGATDYRDGVLRFVSKEFG